VITLGFYLPSGHYRLHVDGEWVDGKLTPAEGWTLADAVSALQTLGLDVPGPSGWEDRGDGGWCITGPATQPATA
jgi:hypothetical protein